MAAELVVRTDAAAGVQLRVSVADELPHVKGLAPVGECALPAVNRVHVADQARITFCALPFRQVEIAI